MNRSIILNPIFPNGICDLYVSVLKSGYFRVAEVWDVEESLFWKRLNRFFTNIIFDVSISPLMVEQGMSIIDFDECIRLRSLKHIFSRIDFLNSIGISNISISSPININKHSRIEAIENLKNSLVFICDYANTKSMQVSFESFDRDYHKRRLIGTTEEFVSLALFIRKRCANFYLIWDTAHVYLQERSLVASFISASEYIKRVHFANACTDEHSPFYGDSHTPFEIGNVHLSDLKLLYQVISEKTNIESMAIEVAVCNTIAEVTSPKTTINYIKNVFRYLGV